ncbi:hypothetical protein [Clostridium sp. ZS1]|uniref:hypothetical protein n=1 Tax=Clostridium sp. ZS1 TaxID=2949989 RepID=UPI00207AF960|nr:hypothetical protein [Clostridium sp. ZS1]
MNAVNSHLEKIFILGFMRRYNESYAYAKQKIEEWYIGNPVLVRFYGLDLTKVLPSFLKFAKNSYNGGFLENRKPTVTIKNGVLSTIIGSVCKEYFETGELVRADYSDYEKLK